MTSSPAGTSCSLKEYLKKYESKPEEKKKKKRKRIASDVNTVVVVDEDPVWQKPVNLDAESGEDLLEEDKPQVDEDIEVKRMRRLELLKARKPYHAISEDGSGWVSLSDESKLLDSGKLSRDISPPRKSKARYDTPSPKRVDDDISSPRKYKTRSDTPPRVDEDISPSRDCRAQNETTSLTSSDISPPRKHKARNDTPLSKNKANVHAGFEEQTDISPPRRGKMLRRSESANTHSDLVDILPPRRGNYSHMYEDISSLRQRHKEVAADGMKEAKIEKISLRGDDSKKQAGNAVSKSAEKREIESQDKLEWGKGLAQKRETEARLLEVEREKSKPFARSRDDPDLDKMFRERLRWGDPMFHLFKQKQPEMVLHDLGDDDAMQNSGFIIPQEVPSHSWLKRGLDAASNRYSIKPGRHWDGVDRSNGYEKELFKRMNEKEASQREAYIWSVSDM